jgi:hypothetical protein
MPSFRSSCKLRPRSTAIRMRSPTPLWSSVSNWSAPVRRPRGRRSGTSPSASSREKPSVVCVRSFVPKEKKSACSAISSARTQARGSLAFPVQHVADHDLRAVVDHSLRSADAAGSAADQRHLSIESDTSSPSLPSPNDGQSRCQTAASRRPFSAAAGLVHAQARAQRAPLSKIRCRATGGICSSGSGWSICSGRPSASPTWARAATSCCSAARQRPPAASPDEGGAGFGALEPYPARSAYVNNDLRRQRRRRGRRAERDGANRPARARRGDPRNDVAQEHHRSRNEGDDAASRRRLTLERPRHDASSRMCPLCVRAPSSVLATHLCKVAHARPPA